MTQADIQDHYREYWGSVENNRHQRGASALEYSSPVEDAVLYPIYQSLIADLRIRVDGGSVLDVGSGSGRWIRYFLDRFNPASVVGLDFAESSVGMLRDWAAVNASSADLRFEVGDITSPGVAEVVGGGFDLINIANVLFHIPEEDKFVAALKNLAGMLGEGGRIVTTEYLPRTTMRTQWMLVRSRYAFEAACARAGLRILDVRASSFFSNDPMGLDGPDAGVRGHFNAVRAGMQQLLGGATHDRSREYLTAMFAEVERACLEFCRERIAQVDLPAQKLVVLGAE